jgi:hypothetical protein
MRSRPRKGRLVELTRAAGRLSTALAAVIVAVHGAPVALVHGETLGHPPSVVLNQDKIDWLTAETDSAAQAVDGEAERPLTQQREALYRDMLARGAELIRVINTIEGRLPRLKARVNEMMTKANAALERIANGKLQIGMSTEQVREVRGGPSRVSLITTATGVRQQWHYGMTVLSFDDGNLVEILLMLTLE